MAVYLFIRMQSIIYYDSVFPYLHLSLDDIDKTQIDEIPQWIEYILHHNPQPFHQINIDASHPQLKAIISKLVECIPTDHRLAYIRIKQSHHHHRLSTPLLQQLLDSIRRHDNNQNITVQFNQVNKVAYY